MTSRVANDILCADFRRLAECKILGGHQPGNHASFKLTCRILHFMTHLEEYMPPSRSPLLADVSWGLFPRMSYVFMFTRMSSVFNVCPNFFPFLFAWFLLYDATQSVNYCSLRCDFFIFYILMWYWLAIAPRTTTNW